MQIQFISKKQLPNTVVICFKFSNFAYANTVDNPRYRVGCKLLFALNLVTLLMQIQLSVRDITPQYSCYLL